MQIELASLRRQLNLDGLQGFIVPRADEHLGEYVPPSAERLAWLTGFTGSAGLAVVLPDKAAVFTDGRYVLQLAAQTDPDLWQRHHITEEPPHTWLAANSVTDARIGYDPLLISEEGLARYTAAGLSMVAVERNPIDAVWIDRPQPPMAAAVAHPLGYAGRASDAKREQIAGLLREAKQDAAVITDPASIAWLLNIRGGDVPYTPFALGFALVHADSGVELFMDPAKLPPAIKAWLGNAVSVAGHEALEPALAKLRGKRVRVDGSRSPVWFAQKLRDAGATVVATADPCLLPKACKNETEQHGVRNAHRRDAVAVFRFSHFLAEAGSARRGNGNVRGPGCCHYARRSRDSAVKASPAISGLASTAPSSTSGVTPESDRTIGANEVYLINYRGAVPGWHDRHHAYRLDRAICSTCGVARARDARVEGPHCDRYSGVS